MTDLPIGWRVETIDSITIGGLISDGDWVESKDQDPNGQVRLTQLADVGDGDFRNRSNRWMNDEQASRLNVNYLKPGDLLLARMPDPLGRTCLVPENIGRAVTVVDVAIIRIARSDINPKFILWLLNSPGIRQQIEMLASGTTRRRITRKNLGTIHLPVPPLPEQHKIVEILEDHLSRLDAALADVKQAKVKADQFRRSLLQAAFTGNLGSDGTRLMTELPDDWKIANLGKIVSIKTGKIDANKAVEGGQYPFFTCAREVSRINEAPYEGKVILVAGNGDLNVKYYEGKFNAYQRTYFLSSLDENLYHPKYLYYFLESYVPTLRSQSIGTTIKYIKMENLTEAEVPLPPLPEQHKLVEILEDHLSRLDASIALADAMEKQSAGLRRSLLQAAFTGQLTKEVASV
jgi:type I restriction enzyme S subunit